MASDAPKVLLSYSHDSPEHARRVLALAERLRSDGVDAQLDQYVAGTPAKGWPRWMDDQLDSAQFILVICTETYRRRFLGREEPGTGKGADWEGSLITLELYQARSDTSKFVPVFFDRHDEPFIPRPLSGHTHYLLSSEDNYAKLYEFLIGQAGVVPAKLGPLKTPTREAVEPLRFGNAEMRVDVCRLPLTEYRLFGRVAPLKQLAEAWNRRKVRIVSVVAMGGTGKTALVSHWLQDLGRDAAWGGAERVFAWSFFSQGASTDRQVSSDLFITEAFKFFGVPDPGTISAWDKGRTLAAAIRSQPALLVLDGLEPLQEPPSLDGRAGQFRDQSVFALLRELATGQSGLCVVTTRLPLVDLRNVHPDNHCEINLEQLDETAGAELLRCLLAPPDIPAKQKEIVARIPENELRQASREFGGHVLALRLLANYLATAHDSDIRLRREIGSILEEETEGVHARRVMRKYEQWFARQPELDVLRMLGLFDRPAEPGAIGELRELPALRGLTERLQNLDHPKWNRALSHLRKAGLLTTEHDGSLDCHPLVREHFRERLRTGDPAAWRAAHSRLYEYFRDLPTKRRPDTLEEMEPLYRSIAHGCEAGRHQEAFQEVYWARIARTNHYFSTRKLGAYGADLAALSNFFQTRWNPPVDSLEPAYKALLLGLVGFRLRALGRSKAAIQPMEAALKAWDDLIDGAKGADPQNQRSRNTNRANAADDACNLSELFLILGEVQKALTHAEQSVKWADESGDLALGVTNRTALGDVLHQAGDTEKALASFREAEAMQKQRRPDRPYLESFRGFRYCELLLSQGAFKTVQEMVSQTLSREEQWMLLDVAMNHLSLGRAALLQAKHENTCASHEALQHLDQAVQGLRQAGRQDYLPAGLLARAALHRVMDAFTEAWGDLAEAQEIAERGEMRLHLADCHLEAARLFWAVKQAAFQPQNPQVVVQFFRTLPDFENLSVGREAPSVSFTDLARTKAREHLAIAKQMIAKMGYRRRNPEVVELENQFGLA